MNASTLLAGIAAAAIASSASAGVNLVTNGSFEQSDYVSDPSHNHSGVEFGVDVFNTGFVEQGVTSWTAPLAGGISFYWIAADGPSTAPIRNRYGDQQATLAASYTGPSPDGGNFVGFDSDFIGDGAGGYNSPFLQSVSGLIVGRPTTLTFYWAGTQLQNRHGPTTDYLTYSLDGDVRQTRTVSVASQGNTGWMKQYASFTPTATTETLQFLAHGTPAGAPPFVLLDGVSLAVPEPASWALLIAGFGLIGTSARRRRPTAA